MPRLFARPTPQAHAVVVRSSLRRLFPSHGQPGSSPALAKKNEDLAKGSIGGQPTGTRLVFFDIDLKIDLLFRLMHSDFFQGSAFGSNLAAQASDNICVELRRD